MGRQRGFNLIEIALALVILTLLLGSVLVPINTQVQQRKFTDTQKTLDDVTDALIGYAMVNGRLPRPATLYNNGVENATSTLCTAGTTAVNEANCTGFIPWTTIGSAKSDSWGYLIRYSVTPAFSTNTPFTTSTVGTKIIQERTTAGVLANSATQVAFVVWSNGAENFGTTDSNTTRVNNSTGTTNVDEITNNSATVTFIKRPFGDNTGATGGEFDDIVNFVPQGTLIYKVVQAGKLP